MGKSMDRRLLQLAQMPRYFGLVAMVTVLQTVALLLQAQSLAQAIVWAWQRQPQAGLWRLIGQFCLWFVVQMSLATARRLLAADAGRKASAQLHDALIHKLYALGPAQLTAVGIAETVTTALDGLQEAERYVELTLSKTLGLAITPGLVVAVIAWHDWVCAALLIGLFPVVIGFMVILGLAAKDRAAKQFGGFMALAEHFVDALRGAEALHHSGALAGYEAHVYATSERYRKQTMAVLQVAMMSGFALDFFGTLSIAIVAVSMGLRLLNGTMSLYPALLILILAPEYFLPIREFGNDYHATLNGKMALKTLFGWLDQPEAATQPAVPDFAWTANSSLAVTNLSHPFGQARGLIAASFTLHAGETIGVIGASGAGKSTLLNLLAGHLTPASGSEISLAGHAVATLHQPDWQALVSYFPQKPYLFADTIAGNIRLYRPDASDEAVQKAATQAGLMPFVATLDAGLATRIGAGGRPLSGGQAQRVALARTLLDAHRRVWLFDEPSARLDIESEAALKAVLAPLFADKLVVIATHRLHWLTQCDRVLVLDQGRLVACGPPATLAQTSGDYQRLIQAMQEGTHDEA